MTIDEWIEELGLVLPEPFPVADRAAVSLHLGSSARGSGFVSGHLPLNVDETLAEPLDKVGNLVSADEGKSAARAVGLAMLGSLKVSWVLSSVSLRGSAYSGW